MFVPNGGKPERYFALAGRPVLQFRTVEGGRAVLALDPATGALLPSYALYGRLREGSVDLDELDKEGFEALVRHWRERIIAECQAIAIHWTRTDDLDFPYAATHGGQRLVLRLNDHPAEPLLTLFVGEQPISHLETWPEAWQVEPSPLPAQPQA
jgi:hypothetical protein